MVIVNPVKLTLKFNYHMLLSTPKIAIFKDTCYYPYKLFRLQKKKILVIASLGMSTLVDIKMIKVTSYGHLIYILKQIKRQKYK